MTIVTNKRMKKVKMLWLMAALVCSLGLSVTSCKDDDEMSAEEKAEQERMEKAEQSEKFWNVVGQLVGMDQACDDYLSKTFTATIGDAQEGNATIRQIITNDAATAAVRFCDLACLPIGTVDENTASYTWQDKEVGSLTYTKTSGTSLATVDVNIKQVPGLRQIVYLTAEQAGKNGWSSFGGTCFYTFGDVISKPNADGKLDYWVCVRPAFGPEGKKTSHWMTVSPLPEANVKEITKSGYTYYLPTKNGVNKEHMQNLAEMLYAIYNPRTWHQNVNSTKVDMFHDFSKKNVKYHSQYFWEMVGDAWTDLKVTKTLFGLSYDKMGSLVNNNHLYFLAGGYSWVWGSSPTLYQYNYTNGDGKQSNMHNLKVKDVSKNVVNPYINFDVRTMTYETPCMVNYEFFGDDNPRFILRFASDEELMGEIPDVYETMHGTNGIKDVYVYNQYYETFAGDDIETQVVNNNSGDWNTNDFFGVYSHYKQGDVYKDQNGDRWLVIANSGVQNGDGSPYAELVCFEGLTPSADKRYITNLPDRDKAIRGAFWLDQLFTDLSDHSKNENYKDWGSRHHFGRAVDYLRSVGYFDPSISFQRIQAQSGDLRQGTHAASIAYKDRSSRQRLLRWIMNNQNAKNDFLWYLSDYYVNSPDMITQFYKSGDYSKTGIYLDHLFYKEYIELFAKDTYAIQPLSKSDAKDNQGPVNPRSIRTEVDSLANDVSNFLYNAELWNNRKFRADMWNEPILMFRYARVYDRGNGDFATVTTDGLQLRAAKISRWLSAFEESKSYQEQLEIDREAWVDYSNSLLGKYYSAINAIYLNGELIELPSWKNIKD